MTTVEEKVEIGGQWVTLRLHRKAETFGSVAVDQWWMPVSGLYGQRGRHDQASNREAITAGFWGLCREGGTQSDADVQESYLLARLVPHVRSLGSRSIFRDGFLRPARRGQDTAIQDLDALLARDLEKEVDEIEFHRQTGIVLGPPALPSEAKAEYLRMEAELLGTARGLLLSDEMTANALVVKQWKNWMRIARGAGNKTFKLVLDVLSYEARTALHRAYSAIWLMSLTPLLHKKYGLSNESAQFLAFWHLEPSRETADPSSYFHLFHGHVFGLHPAGAAFLQTHTGRQLVGEWLAASAHDPISGQRSQGLHQMTAPSTTYNHEQKAYRRVLNGLLKSVFEYHRRHTDVANDRRR